MLRLSIVILNYGTPALTIAAAESVLADMSGIAAAIVIVDNASPDDSIARLAAWRTTLPAAAPVEIVRSAVNSGYAGGNNLGVRSQRAERYVLLNSDTLVKPGTFKALLAEMDRDPRLGILGPPIVDECGLRVISRFRHHSPLGEFVDATGAEFFFKLLRRRVVMIFSGETASHDWIGFPCVMLRRDMIEEIGLLDEGYFLYFEDADYCRRAHNAGWRIGVAEAGEVVHFVGGSSKVEHMSAARSRFPAYFYASRTRYLKKWHGTAGYVAANLFWYLGRAAGYVRLLTFKAPPPAPKGRAVDIWTAESQGRPPGAAPFVQIRDRSST